MGAGAFLELLARGKKTNFFITYGNPQIEFFTAVIIQHTPFITTTRKIVAQDKPNYGKTSQFRIPRWGDFLGSMYLHIELETWIPPEIQPYWKSPNLIIAPPNTTITDNKHLGFVNGIGEFIIDTATFKFPTAGGAGTPLATLDGHWLNVAATTFTPPALWSTYCENVGRTQHFSDFSGVNVTANAIPGDNGRLTIPLPFSWCNEPKNALPIWEFSNEMRLDVTLRRFEDLIYMTDVSDRRQIIDPRGKTFTYSIDGGITTEFFNVPSSLNIANCWLEIDYITVDDIFLKRLRKMERMATTPRYYTFDTIEREIGQIDDRVFSPNQSIIAEIPIPIRMFRYIRELIWITHGRDQQRLNEHDNYSPWIRKELEQNNIHELYYTSPLIIAENNGIIVDPEDIPYRLIRNSGLQLMSLDRLKIQSSDIWQFLMPFRYHKYAKLDQNIINYMPLSTRPDIPLQPSGGIDFSAVIRGFLRLQLEYIPNLKNQPIPGAFPCDPQVEDETNPGRDRTSNVYIWGRGTNFLEISRNNAKLAFV